MIAEEKLIAASFCLYHDLNLSEVLKIPARWQSLQNKKSFREHLLPLNNNGNRQRKLSTRAGNSHLCDSKRTQKGRKRNLCQSLKLQNYETCSTLRCSMLCDSTCDFNLHEIPPHYCRHASGCLTLSGKSYEKRGEEMFSSEADGGFESCESYGLRIEKQLFNSLDDALAS
jgi:hypothetical protein